MLRWPSYKLGEGSRHRGRWAQAGEGAGGDSAWPGEGEDAGEEEEEEGGEWGLAARHWPPQTCSRCEVGGAGLTFQMKSFGLRWPSCWVAEWGFKLPMFEGAERERETMSQREWERETEVVIRRKRGFQAARHRGWHPREGSQTEPTTQVTFQLSGASGFVVIPPHPRRLQWLFL